METKKTDKKYYFLSDLYFGISLLFVSVLLEYRFVSKRECGSLFHGNLPISYGSGKL
jgi:hypothetical protein